MTPFAYVIRYYKRPVASFANAADGAASSQEHNGDQDPAGLRRDYQPIVCAGRARLDVPFAPTILRSARATTSSIPSRSHRRTRCWRVEPGIPTG